MIPSGLKPPEQSTFRDAVPAKVSPKDFPSRLPFVTDQECSFAESEDVAVCIWPLTSEEHEAEEPDTNRGERHSPSPGTAAHAPHAVADLLAPDPRRVDSLGTLFSRVVKAAEEVGWQRDTEPGRLFPPGARLATLTRGGLSLMLMASLTPWAAAVTAWCYREPAA